MQSRPGKIKFGRKLVAILVILVCTLVVAQPVLASVTSSVDGNGVLTVTSDADDEIKIWCSEGKVFINGFAPGSGEVNCSTITKIVANGGPGNNIMDLTGVTLAAFPSIFAGKVEMYGGNGNDIMLGSEFGDLMYGDDGDDTQFGGNGDDEQDGGDGNDKQDGGDGDDYQDGGDGDDMQYGGDGNDLQRGSGGNDEQFGGAGSDRQYGGIGDDTQYGGTGDDTQLGGSDDDEQYGGDGVDMQVGDEGDDVQDGGGGNDEQVGGEGDDTQYGGEGDDTQYGVFGDDEQVGGEGDDTQYGGFGDDTQYGGAGNDVQVGSEGDDTQYGGAGDDDQFGGNGNDTQYQEPGSADIVNDEAGDDTLDFSLATSAITLDLDLQDVDQVVDAVGNTLRIEGQFENFVGSPFDDVIFADPLTVPRSLDGGVAPATLMRSMAGVSILSGDVLNFDAQGLPVTDTGTELIVEGYAPVAYTNFDTVNIINTQTKVYLVWMAFN